MLMKIIKFSYQDRFLFYFSVKQSIENTIIIFLLNLVLYLIFPR